MTWTEAPGEQDAYTEWRRDDDCATIRLRPRRDGWVVRLDRLTQAPEGSLYLETRVDTREGAARVVKEWQAAHDLTE